MALRVHPDLRYCVLAALPGVVLAVCSGCSTTNGDAARMGTPAAGGNNSAVCDSVLKLAGVDVVAVSDRSELTAAVRQFVRDEQSRSEGSSSSSSTGASFGYKGIDFGFENESAYQSFLQQYAFLLKDDTYVLGEQQSKSLLFVHGNSDAIGAWKACVTPQPDVRLQILPSKDSGKDFLTFEMVFAPNDGTRNGRLDRVYVVNGSIIGSSKKEGDAIVRNAPYTFDVKPEAGKVARLTVVCEPFGAASNEGFDPVAARDSRAAELKAQAEQQEAIARAKKEDEARKKRAADDKRAAEEKRRTMARPLATGQSRMDGKFGGEKRNDVLEAIASPGQRIARIVFWHNDSIIKGMEVFAQNGSLGKIGCFDKEYEKTDFKLDDDEFLIQVQIECGKYTDWMKLWTNKGRMSKEIGGRGDHRDPMPTLDAGANRKIVGFRLWSTNCDIEGVQIITEPIDP